ncbi:hypothetical protein ACEQPO_01260 [Bacillus sp. SL00103]
MPYHSQAAALPKETDVIIVYKNQKGKQTAIEESEKVNAQYIHLPAVAVTADEQAVTSLKQDPNIAYVSKNIKGQTRFFYDEANRRRYWSEFFGSTILQSAKAECKASDKRRRDREKCESCRFRYWHFST